MKSRKYKPRYFDFNDVSQDLYTIGNDESTFELTLATSTTVTTVTNAMVGKDSVITFMAMTADASSENIWVSARGSGTFDITHSSGSSTRTFGFVVYG